MRIKMIPDEKITGIILAGGKSSRMGQDKGLIKLKGKRLIDIAIDHLQPFCHEIIISSASDNYKHLGFRTIPDEISGIGPMGGIYSSLKASLADMNFVLSFDMPLVSEDIIRFILNKIADSQITVPWEGAEFYQPLCGYYNKSVLNSMEKLISQENYKLIELFRKIRFNPLRIDNKLPFYKPYLFLNVNRPEDIREAEMLMPE